MHKITKWFRSRQKTAGQANRDSKSGPAAIEEWMLDKIGDELNVPSDTLDPNEPLTSYGLDSITGFTLTLDLAEWLGRDLPATLLWEYPTISALANFLAQDENSD